MIATLAGMSLATRVRALRTKAGMSAYSLAQECQVEQATIYKVESGKTKDPGVSLVWRIADALGTTIDHVVGRDDGEAAPVTEKKSSGALAKLEARIAALESKPVGTPEPLPAPKKKASGSSAEDRPRRFQRRNGVIDTSPEAILLSPKDLEMLHVMGPETPGIKKLFKDLEAHAEADRKKKA